MTAAAGALGVAALVVTRPAIHRLTGLPADIVRSEPLDEPTR